jgi:hypothetical protein
MLDDPVELEYEVQFEEICLGEHDGSLLLKVILAFGVGRFTIADLHKILRPERHPSHIAEDAKQIELAAEKMERQNFLVGIQGPRGGKGWGLTDNAVESAKRLQRLPPGGANR